MLTLLGSLLGLLGSFVPEILKHLRDQSDKGHELELLDRQLRLRRRKQQDSLEYLEALHGLAETDALYHHARPVHIPWVDSLSGAVRPLITYTFFLLYVGVKVSEGLLLYGGVAPEVLLLHLWHPEDQALFAAVMSFWFGQRSLIKRRFF